MGISGDLNVKAKLDTTEFDATEVKIKHRLRRLNDQIFYTDYSLSQVARRSVTVIGSITRTLEAVSRLMPGVVDPAYEAIYQTILSTVSSLTSIAVAYAAGGVTMPFAVIVESAAIALSIYGLAQALAGQADASRELRRMNMEVRNLGVQMQSLRSSFAALGGVF